MHCAAIASRESGHIAWRGGAHMRIGAMCLRSISLQLHHGHLTRSEWCRSHRGQRLAAATEADTYVVAIRLLHAHHMLRCGLLGYDLRFSGHLGRCLKWR